MATFLAFADHLSNDERADLILCMGDTLTHLDTVDAVGALSRTVANRLAPGGRFVATFRDSHACPPLRHASFPFGQMNTAS